MNIKILICCHKKNNFKELGGAPPIHIREFISDIDLRIIDNNRDTYLNQKNASDYEQTGINREWRKLKATNYIKAKWIKISKSSFLSYLTSKRLVILP